MRPSVELKDCSRKDDLCRVYITLLEGTGTVSATLQQAEKKTVVAREELQSGKFHSKTEHPEIQLKLIDGEHFRVHVKITEFRSTLSDGFAFGGSESDPQNDKDPSGRPIEGKSNISRAELNDRADRYLATAAGYWFFVVLKRNGGQGNWFGPFGSEDEAKGQYKLVCDKFADPEYSAKSSPPKHYPRAPTRN
jgi:hypothetical protein